MLLSYIVFCFYSGTCFDSLLDAFALDVVFEKENGGSGGDGQGKADADAYGDADFSVGGLGGYGWGCEICRWCSLRGSYGGGRLCSGGNAAAVKCQIRGSWEKVEI